MDLFNNSNDWTKKLEPIFRKYKGRKHPLEYHNLYQLVIMVVLSAQDSDDNINLISPALFKAFPNMTSIAEAKTQAIIPYVSKVRFHQNKIDWLLEIAKKIKKDENIPLTMKGLTALKGIGRKSANVIMREAHEPVEGIITDLHVIRVAPRIGIIAETKDGIKAEQQLMSVFPKEVWREIGMAISFLGREICRPKPKCPECPINNICKYYQENK